MRLDAAALKSELNEFWWERVPAVLTRLTTSLSALLTDGAYLAGWPTAGAFVPLGAVALGLTVGAGLLREPTHLTFTYSIPLMILLIAIAHLGGALGVWFAVGYAVGDLLFFPHLGGNYPTAFQALIRDYLPLLVSYAVLVILLGVIPSVASRLRDRTIRRLDWGTAARLAAGAAIQGAGQGVLTYLWVLAAPALIRPVFTYRSLSAPADAFAPLQTHGEVLVVASVVLGVVRSILEAAALRDPKRATRVADLLFGVVMQAAARDPAGPRPARLIARVLLMVFLMMGLIESWAQAVVVILVLGGIVWVQDILLPSRARGWLELLERVPLIVRFIVGLAISSLAARTILSAMWSMAGGSMAPGLYSILFSLIVFALLFPRPARTQEQAPLRSGSVTVTVIVMATVLLGGASPLQADNCSSITDCFFGFVGALLAIIAIVLILFLLFFFFIIPAAMSWIDDLIMGSGSPSTTGAGAGGVGDAAGSGVGGTASTGGAGTGGAVSGGGWSSHVGLTAEEILRRRVENVAAREAIEAARRARTLRDMTQAVARTVEKLVRRIAGDPSGEAARGTVEQIIKSIPQGGRGRYISQLLGEVERQIARAATEGQAALVRNLENVRSILEQMAQG